jgi:hypothetical protein
MSECPLCRALKNEKDKILFQDDDVTILPTKDTYGHKKRIMVISKNISTRSRRSPATTIMTLS